MEHLVDQQRCQTSHLVKHKNLFDQSGIFNKLKGKSKQADVNLDLSMPSIGKGRKDLEGSFSKIADIKVLTSQPFANASCYDTGHYQGATYLSGDTQRLNQSVSEQISALTRNMDKALMSKGKLRLPAMPRDTNP